jgi:hypothetical protein
MTDQTTDPTERMHDIANRNSQACMAAIGREMVKGTGGFKFGMDPQDFIREAIMRSMQEVQNVEE